VCEHEPICVWAYSAERLVDMWKRRDGDAIVEKERSGGGGRGGGKLYSEKLVERKEPL